MDVTAVSLPHAALSDAEQSVGPLDGLTIRIRADLAHGHAARDALDLALAEMERAATDSETALGADHPDTVGLRADLAALARDRAAATDGVDRGVAR